jgi:hypothetical protein
MKHWKTTLAVFATVCASLAVADDIKTVNGKEYKNATVSRVEPDGIMIKFSGGLVKIPFTVLSEELKEKYHYNPEEARKFSAENAAAINALNAGWRDNPARNKTEQEEELLLRQIRIFAIMKPYIYGKEQTHTYIQAYEKYWEGPTAYDFNWRKVGERFTGVIDQRMPDYLERDDVVPVALYRIGHTDDSSRDPLYTLDKEKALRALQGANR